MKAKNGSAVSLLSRGRLIGSCMALVLALSALLFGSAAAQAVAPPTTTYLALGDSISFGYTAEKFGLHEPNDSPSYFEEGFTNYFTADLKKTTEVGKTIRLVDDGCPGETSNGLIGENPSLGGQASTEGPGHPQGPGDFHPCAYHFVDGLPLHNSLATFSQLEDALFAVLPKEKVEAISLQIGSNDELAGVEECKNEITHEFETKGYAEQPHPGNIYALNGKEPQDKQIELEAFQACLGNQAVTKTSPRIIENILDVIGQLDATGYTKPIVLIGFYNPDAFILPGTDALQEGLNASLKAAVEASPYTNVHWANPMPKFNHKPGTVTQEYNAVKTFTEMCNPNVQKPETGLSPGCEGDIHPSLAGYKLMAKLANEAYLAPALP
jgi:lysophospholipase L1-like esterase